MSNDEIMLDTITLDPNDPIEKVFIEAVRLNRRKRHDYADDNDIFSNFKEAADLAGLKSPGQSIEALLGTKAARLKQLLWGGKEALNESVRDTLIDRLVYSAIAVAAFDELLYMSIEKGYENVRCESPNGPNQGLTVEDS